MVCLYVNPCPGTCLFKLGHALSSTNNTEHAPRQALCLGVACSGVESNPGSNLFSAPRVLLAPSTVAHFAAWASLQGL